MAAAQTQDGEKRFAYNKDTGVILEKQGDSWEQIAQVEPGSRIGINKKFGTIKVKQGDEWVDVERKVHSDIAAQQQEIMDRMDGGIESELTAGPGESEAQFGRAVIGGGAKGLAKAGFGIAQVGASLIDKLRGKRTSDLIAPGAQSLESRVTRAAEDTMSFYRDMPESRHPVFKGSEMGGEALPFMLLPGGAPAGFLRGTAYAGGMGTLAGATKYISPEEAAAGETRGGNMMMAGGVGGGLGALTQLPAMAVRGFMRGGESGRRAMVQNVNEFRAAGIEPTAGMAASARAQGTEAMIAKSPGGRNVLVKAGERMQAEGGRFADDLARDVGKADPIRAGRGLIKGVEGFVEKTRERWRAMNNVIDDAIPASQPFAMNNTRKFLDDATGGLADNPALLKLKATIEEASNGGPVPYAVLAKLRRQIGEKVGSPSLLEGFSKGELRQLYKHLSNDVREGLRNVMVARPAGMSDAAYAAMQKAQGNKLVKTFDEANRFYAKEMGRVEDILEPIVSKDTPELVFNAAMAGTKEGPTKILHIKHALNQVEGGDKIWRNYQASVIKQMGRANPSQQDAAGMVFSTEKFLTNLDHIRKTSPRSLDALFGSKTVVRSDIEKIAKVAEKFREARMYQNPSGTGHAVAGTAATQVGAAAVLRRNFDIALSIFGTMAGFAAAGNLFASPKFVHWLAQSTSLGPNQVPRMMTGLRAVMAAESDPEIKDALGELHGGLSEKYSSPAQ